MNRLAITAVLVLVVALSSAAPMIGSTADIVVTTISDATNGDTSSVAALIANPGPDGVSLREAIIATNNDPGTHTIRFAPALKGATIALGSDLPPLTSGGVTIEGDIDGDGRPGVTLSKAAIFTRTYCPNDAGGCGLEIASSGNRVHALTLVGFGIGVAIENWQPTKALPPMHQTFSNNIVSAVVMRRIGRIGIFIGSDYNDNCGLYAGHSEPCWTYDTWADTTISGNVVESGYTGIEVFISNAGDRVENITVTDNTVQISGTDEAIGFNIGANAAGVVISGGLIARNTIVGRTDVGILVGGGNRTTGNVIEAVQVLDNRLELVSQDSSFCCQGIVVLAGSDAPAAIFPNVLPLAYPDRNETRNIVVRGNTVSGTLVWGIAVQAGLGAGGSSNYIHDIQIQRNTIASSTLAPGVLIMTAGGGPPIGGRYADGNKIARVVVNANRISIGERLGTPTFAASGVLLMGGGAFGRNGSVQDIQIVNNVIGPGRSLVLLIGGDEGATGNQLGGVQIVNDTVADPGSPGLQIISNENVGKGTAGNSVTGVTVVNSIFTGSFAGEVAPSMIYSSIVSDPSFAGSNGNILADPKFVDPLNGNYHLQAGSPAIDAGTSIGAPATDFDGLLRSDGRIDIGAYEFGGTAPPPPNPCTTTGTPASTTYLPNITRRLGGPSGWDTPFYVQNAGSAAATIEASFYFFDTGGFATCHKYSNVTPGASILDDPNLASDLLDGKQYAVVVKSFGSASVAAVNQLQTTASGALEALSYSGFNGGNTTVYLPNVTRRFYGYDVPLIIQNLGTASANITATFTSFSGTQIVSIPLTIGAGLSGVIDPDYDTHGLTDQTQYAVKLTSSQPIGVVANAHSEAGSPVAFSHNGLATGAAALYAPYATKSASFSSPVVVQNVGGASTTATLTFSPLGGGTAQVFTTGSIASGGSTAFDVRFDNGIALPNVAPCTSASVTCLGNGDYSLVITTGGLVAAVVLPNSNTTAAGYLAAVAPTSKVVLPVVQRNAAGWNGYIYLQSVAATTATLSYYAIGTGTLATSQTVTLGTGTGIKIAPATVTGLADGQQYSVVITADGILTAIVDEVNPAPGDGTMIYEGFAQ